MNFRHLNILVVAAVIAASCSDSVTPGPGPGGPIDTGGVHVDTTWDVRVVATYPHSETSFTQGLIWVDTALGEGSTFSVRFYLRHTPPEAARLLQVGNDRGYGADTPPELPPTG